MLDEQNAHLLQAKINLSCIVSDGIVKPNPEKVQSIQACRRPSKKTRASKSFAVLIVNLS